MLYFILIIEDFALLFPPMWESVSLVLLSHAQQLQCRKDIEYCFRIDFCTWLLHVQISTYTCTQKWAIVVACHHSMNMHDGNEQLPFPSCLPAFYALAIPMSCYISNVFYYLFAFIF